MLFKSLLVASGLGYAAASRSCSSENTASSFSAVANIYNSGGLCLKTCGDSYTYGILQDNECWCSNSAPSSTVDISECDESCPGYPDEKCGSKDGSLYSYFIISDDEDAIIGANQTAAYTGSVTWTGSVTATASASASSSTGAMPTNGTAASNATATAAGSSTNGSAASSSWSASAASSTSYQGAANTMPAFGMGATALVLGAAAALVL